MKNPPTELKSYATLAANALGAVVSSYRDGLMAISFARASDIMADTPVILCNAPLIARYMGLAYLPPFDVLELFAFVRPAETCVPTIGGLADAVGIARPSAGLENEAIALEAVVEKLLAEVAAPDYRYKKGAYRILKNMAAAGWSWGPLVLAHLPVEEVRHKAPWQDLSEWEDGAPPPFPDDFPIGQDDVDVRLAHLLGDNAEQRRDQVNYARSAVHAFIPREHQEAPNALILEAGTGIGKTLGYIAPASLWAEKNNGPVWLSTYTKNLQRQIDQELDRLFVKAQTKAQKVVIRKGRENYICLLNLEESLGKNEGEGAFLTGLILRWVQFSRDGDMVGGDFPSWLSGHFGNRVSQLTDRRGECVYSACSHYRRCFIEKARRRAKDAQLVVANHALVMFEALTRGEENEFSRRIVFDEGHHLFDAADSAFSLHLSGLEARELRSWIRGKEKKGVGRARGLRNRIDDLIADDHKALELLDEIFEAAFCLPGDGWLQRLSNAAGIGPVEEFLVLVRAHVLTRAAGESYHDLEAPTNDPIDGLIEAAAMLNKALLALAKPMAALVARVKRLMDEKAEDFSSSDRARLDAVVQSLARRAEMIMQGWAAMVSAIGAAPEEGFVDWFAIARNDKRDYDVGLHRHYLDPTIPFSKIVLERSHGVIITSATLRDKSKHEEDTADWASADVRSGAGHLIIPPRRFSYESPFNYAENSKVIIVTDVNRNEPHQVAGAYRSLFEASQGGALGLFTAISRLKSIYNLISKPLEEKGLRVGAQHIDPMDVATLVDIFRDDPTSCLLGTDALRDGVDVPGDALKLIVFDRVPWPRPSILHKARRGAFGGSHYDDMVTRLRLKQAFGRLIRKKDDRGIFIILDSRTPSRLLDAFPAQTEVMRIGLKDAVTTTSSFFSSLS